MAAEILLLTVFKSMGAYSKYAIEMFTNIRFSKTAQHGLEISFKVIKTGTHISKEN